MSNDQTVEIPERLSAEAKAARELRRIMVNQLDDLMNELSKSRRWQSVSQVSKLQKKVFRTLSQIR